MESGVGVRVRVRVRVRGHLEHELEREEHREVEVELLEPPAHLHLKGAAARSGRRQPRRVDGEADGRDDDEHDDECVPHRVARDAVAQPTEGRLRREHEERVVLRPRRRRELREVVVSVGAPGGAPPGGGGNGCGCGCGYGYGCGCCCVCVRVCARLEEEAMLAVSSESSAKALSKMATNRFITR